MDGSYTIEVDAARNLVRLTLRGFMDLASVKRFAEERIAAMKKLRCGRNRHVTLCDISQQMISTPEVIEAFKQMIGDQRFAARRLAFVVDSALAKIQAQRTAHRDQVGYFADVASAEAWLFEEAPVTPADIDPRAA